MWPLVKFSRSQHFNYKGISFVVFLLAGVCSASNLGLIKLREVLQFSENNRVNLPLKAVGTKNLSSCSVFSYPFFSWHSWSSWDLGVWPVFFSAHFL